MTLRNPLGQLATEETLGELVGRTNSQGDALLMSGSRSRWRREFNDTTLAAWSVVKADSMTVTAGAVATGALQVALGTTPNAETTITSKVSFRAPFRAQFGVQLSSKIANVEVYLEVVAENEDGTLDETCVAAWRIAGSDSTTTTVARTEVRNGGDTRSQSPNVASQAAQNAASIYEVVLEADEVRFYSKVADNAAARSLGQVRNTVAPDPNRTYRLRYRLRTGTNAPASNVTFTSAFATCVDYTEQQVEVSGGNGSINGDQAIPVYNAGGTVTVGNGSSMQVQASASVNGAAIAKVRSAASANAVLVKNAAGRIYGYHFVNTSSAWRYVKMFNKATAPASTDAAAVVVRVIPIRPGGEVVYTSTVPLSFAAGIGYTITASPSETDFTALTAADEVIGSIDYV